MEAGNQIWGPYLELIGREESTSELHYIVKNNRVSPYLELQADSLYESAVFQESLLYLDVNPYLRFFSIFNPLLTPDDLGYEEFQQELSDVLLHYLAELDLRTGRCKRDFYIDFLVQDLKSGAFGGISELSVFTELEKRSAAKWLLHFYCTGDGPGSFSGAAKAILPGCEIFIRDGEEFVIHMREQKKETSQKKLLFLIRLFLPISCPYTIHWIRTYGVIGYEAGMQLGDFVLA